MTTTVFPHINVMFVISLLGAVLVGGGSSPPCSAGRPSRRDYPASRGRSRRRPAGELADVPASAAQRPTVRRGGRRRRCGDAGLPGGRGRASGGEGGRAGPRSALRTRRFARRSPAGSMASCAGCRMPSLGPPQQGQGPRGRRRPGHRGPRGCGSPSSSTAATRAVAGQGVYTRHLSRALVRRRPPRDGVRRPAVARSSTRAGVHAGAEPGPLPRARPVPHPPAGPARSPRPPTPSSWRRCGAAASPSRGPSRRARAALAGRRGEFDLVHDNQGPARAAAACRPRAGRSSPRSTTRHVDRRLDLSRGAGNVRGQFSLARWYGFAAMQNRVAAISAHPHLESSRRHRRDGRRARRIAFVPLGVDDELFRPLAGAGGFRGGS